ESAPPPTAPRVDEQSASKPHRPQPPLRARPALAPVAIAEAAADPEDMRPQSKSISHWAPGPSEDDPAPTFRSGSVRARRGIVRTAPRGAQRAAPHGPEVRHLHEPRVDAKRAC